MQARGSRALGNLLLDTLAPYGQYTAHAAQRGDQREMTMDSKTREMILGWLADHKGDSEAVARFMRDSLRIGGIRECRELVARAEGGAK